MTQYQQMTFNADFHAALDFIFKHKSEANNGKGINRLNEDDEMQRKYRMLMYHIKYFTNFVPNFTESVSVSYWDRTKYLLLNETVQKLAGISEKESILIHEQIEKEA